MKANTIIFLLFGIFLINSGLINAEEKKIGFIVTDQQDDDELAAMNWFQSIYSNSNGDLISAFDIKNKLIDLNQYSVLWIHIDKENISEPLPIILLDNEVLSSIINFYKKGGNLLLTTHATQYLYQIGRTKCKPNIFDKGSAKFNADVWSINPNIGLNYNHSNHSLFNNLTTINEFDYPTIPLIGSGLKEDHNSMWNLNLYGYNGNLVDAFENDNDANVLATWGQVTDYSCVGIVEFLPNSEYFGNCICIGVGAYEWNQNDRSNVYQSNIERLTSNAISYLSSVDSFIQPINPDIVAHFPMELNETFTSVKEICSNRTFLVENSKMIRENIPGAEGKALRFDGFSTFIKGRFNVTNLNTKAISSSIWCAFETYPMMDINGADISQTCIAGNLGTESGFAFTINCNGRYGFEVFIDGNKVSCFAPDKFPKYEWVNLSAVVSIRENEIKLFKNNVLIAKKYFAGNQIDIGSPILYIGKSYEDKWIGPFRTNTVNGLIDDYRIYSGEQDFSSLKYTPENLADLTIPEIRFQNDIQRPIFHPIPGANWTNEPHGLLYYNDQYHLFFQKNANGPYWGRIHWGHLSSKDLISWKEEKIAIEPSESYDIKGAWSGCIYSDPSLTDNKPHIFYTSVDFAKASISEAYPLDINLINWEKKSVNPIIPYKPIGLSDDFRDCYIFKSSGIFYLIVGTSKDGKGTVTLHEYDPNTKSWSNDGRIFYQASNTDYGTFWEMPFIVPMNNGKWLFGVTPLGSKNGVETLYWVGKIGINGKFIPDSQLPKEVELGNMSRDGFGLLSPSIMQKDGKNIVIGIVPDKLSGDDNKRLGWAHLFSLPREWSLDENNNLIQKPFEGLKNLRDNTISYSLSNQNLIGSKSMYPVMGKAIEIEGIFTISSNQNQRFGFVVRKSGENGIKIFYETSSNKFIVDARNINRLSNDNWLYNGLYESELPETLTPGENLKMNIFIDHSIMDIFLNDKWAFSIRIFPTDVDSDGVDVFAEGAETFINSLNAWKFFSSNNTNLIRNTQNDSAKIYFKHDEIVYENIPENSKINIYDSMGNLLVNQKNIENYKGRDLPKKNFYIVQIQTEGKLITKKVIKN
jgi:beta-fructofuranosidase